MGAPKPNTTFTSMEHGAIFEANFPKPASRMFFDRGRVSSSQATHKASSSIDLNFLESLDSMAHLH